MGLYGPAQKDPDKPNIRIWRKKISRKSGFAKVERICKHYVCGGEPVRPPIERRPTVYKDRAAL